MKLHITHNDIQSMVLEVLSKVGDRGLLSEITAVDAYAKFYQGKIPKNVYDTVMSDAPQMTPLHKLTLDYLVEGYAKGSYKDQLEFANEVVRFWTNANNEARQYAVRICKNNEESFKTNGERQFYYFAAVLRQLMAMKTHSENSYNKRGFEALYEDDCYRITCTKSYASSVKNYGKSHWCTASDQFGQYDGHEMFRSYTSNGILVQFDCKGNPNGSYQAQYVVSGRKIVPNAICDWYDNPVDVEDVEDSLKQCGISYSNIMKIIRKNYKRLFAETQEIRSDEEFYWTQKRDERIKTVIKSLNAGVSAPECAEFAKKIFINGDGRFITSDDGVYSGKILNSDYVVETPLKYAVVYYNGKSKSEKDFLTWYFQDEGYQEYTYDVIASAIFVFDGGGNIVCTYKGDVSIFKGTLLYISTFGDEDLYDGETLYIIDIKTGKPIFTKPYGALSFDSSYNHLEVEMFPDEGEDFNIEDWLVVSPKYGEMYAINYKTAKMVEIPFESYLF